MSSPNDHVWSARELVAMEPAERDDEPTVVGRLQRLCRAATRDLPASGVGVSVVSETGDLLTAAASSRASVVLEELQFSLGEGPCLAAIESRSPVLVPDLTGNGGSSWPGYASAARQLGVRAVFAFPLRVGVARLGVMDVYRARSGKLSGWATSRAIGYADVALETMLDGQRTGQLVPGLADAAETRFEVYQAQGMVMVQLEVTADEALSRIRGHAFAQDRRLVDVAEDIIARRLSLEPDERGA